MLENLVEYDNVERAIREWQWLDFRVAFRNVESKRCDRAGVSFWRKIATRDRVSTARGCECEDERNRADFQHLAAGWSEIPQNVEIVGQSRGMVSAVLLMPR